MDLAFAGNDRCRTEGYIYVPVGIKNILKQAIEPPIANAIEVGSEIPARLPHPVAGRAGLLEKLQTWDPPTCFADIVLLSFFNELLKPLTSRR